MKDDFIIKNVNLVTMLKEKLTEAIEAKSNDVKTFVWKFAKDKQSGEQKEVSLMDATPEELNQFYNHCLSMLYSEDKTNPGRYTLLNIIKEQREKCNVELFLRDLESGRLTVDGKPYPRHLYCQDCRAYIDAHKEQFPSNELKNISISSLPLSVPREYSRISIDAAFDGCLDQLGVLYNKSISRNFILDMGIYLTPSEMKEFEEKDIEGNLRSRMEVIKERLGIKSKVHLVVKSTGLNFTELRAMINLRPKKYSLLTSDQLVTLRNKVLFKLENKVKKHAEQWETRLNQIFKVCEVRGIPLN